MSETPQSPYKGLNAFDDSELDALLFFGRERETEVVVANLIASRLTVLYGPSGVGKSSLLKAAVVRRLRELPEAPLVVVFSRWGGDPAAALAASLGGDGATAVEALERAQSEHDVYVVLDQMEEYFLYHADDGGPGSFAEVLPALLAAPLRVNVLISLREDSLAKLDRFTGRVPGLFANTLRLDLLDPEAARAAITRPVERFGSLTGAEVGVETALVDRVLDDVTAGRIDPGLGGSGTVPGENGQARIEAPYLQLVMQRVWEEERAAGSDVLRLETLDRLGGAPHIVEEHLEGALDQLSSEQQDVAARLFDHLVTPSGTKIAHETSDLADFGRVSVDEVEPVLETLAERRILRSLDEGGRIRYEIFHDVLAEPVLAWRARHRAERELERRLEEQHRRRSRIQRLLALGIGLLLLAAVLVGFALVQRANADEQAQEAEARALDGAAIRLLGEDPELSLLLASESARLAPGSTTEDALRQALLGSQVRDVQRTDAPIVELEFATDGRTYAFTGEDGRARVIDAASGRERFTTEVGESGGVSFGSLLVHGAAGPPRVLDERTGDVVCTLGDRPVGDAAMADGLAVVVSNVIGYVWSVRPCRLVHTIGEVGEMAVRIEVSPDGRRAAFVSGPEALVVDLETGATVSRLVIPRASPERNPAFITSLAFSDSGVRAVTGDAGDAVRIWNAERGTLVHTLDGSTGQVLDVAFHTGANLVASAHTDGMGRIWGAKKGALRATLSGHTLPVGTIEISRDGEYAVTASDDGTARTWSVTGRALATLAGHEGKVMDASFSPDGFTVLTGGEDGTVRLWEAATRPLLTASDRDPPEPARATATSADGHTATVTGRVVVLERADGTSAELAEHDRSVSSVAFSPDGERLLTAGRDKTVVLWDVATGKPLRILRGHFGVVNDARFSGDGRWIVTAGPRSLGLWTAAEGELVRLLYGPEGPFMAAAFLDDSRTIVAATGNGVVGSYPCRICSELPELLELADERLAETGRVLTPEERALYLG